MRTLAISNIACRDGQILAKHCRKVEVAPTILDPWETLTQERCTYWRNYYLEHNLEIAVVQSVLYNIHCQMWNGTALPYLKRALKISRWLGAKIMVLGSPKTRKKIGNGAEKTLEQTAILAEQEGVIVGLEANPPSYGAELWTTLKDACSVVKRINHSHLRLHLDTGCMMLGNENVDDIIECQQWLCHCHVSEPQLKAVRSDLHIHFAEALNKTDYNGLISIEMEKCNSDALTQVVNFVREIYQVGE